MRRAIQWVLQEERLIKAKNYVYKSEQSAFLVCMLDPVNAAVESMHFGASSSYPQFYKSGSVIRLQQGEHVHVAIERAYHLVAPSNSSTGVLRPEWSSDGTQFDVFVHGSMVTYRHFAHDQYGSDYY